MHGSSSVPQDLLQIIRDNGGEMKAGTEYKLGGRSLAVLRMAVPESVASQLTRAQCRVLMRLLDGLSEKDTAEALKISPHTVHNHVRDIYSILNVHSRGELLALLLKH